MNFIKEFFINWWVLCTLDFRCIFFKVINVVVVQSFSVTDVKKSQITKTITILGLYLKSVNFRDRLLLIFVYFWFGDFWCITFQLSDYGCGLYIVRDGAICKLIRWWCNYLLELRMNVNFNGFIYMKTEWIAM